MRVKFYRFLTLLVLLHGNNAPLAVSQSEDPGGFTQDRDFTSNKLQTRSRTLQQLSRDLCPDGSRPKRYRCGCEVVAARAVNAVSELSRNEALQCTPLCGNEPTLERCKKTVRENCSSYVCVKDGCGVTGLASSDVRNMQNGCEWNKQRGWYVCGGGMTVDDATYTHVADSECVPVCGRAQLSCQFPASFGPPIFNRSPSPKTTEDEVLQDPINCKKRQEPDGYLCSCQVASSSEMEALIEVMGGQNVPCVPYCGDQDRAISRCKRSSCDTNLCIGPRKGIMCGTFVNERITNAIFHFDCEDDRRRGTALCTSASGSYVELDEPSFNTITSGFCFPGCNIPVSDLRCRFNTIIKRAFLNETDEEVLPPQSALAPESTPASESAVAPESTPASESAVAPESTPASESAVAPASESEMSPEPSAPINEPEDAPDSSEAPYSEPLESSISTPYSEPEYSDVAPFSESTTAPYSESEYSEVAPASESTTAPYSEPEYIYSEVSPISESTTAPYSEPEYIYSEVSPISESTTAPYSEPEYIYSEVSPISESTTAPYSEPEYMYSEIAPILDSEIAPYSEVAVFSYEAMASASAPDFDICDFYLRRLESPLFDDDATEDYLNANFEIPSFCIPSPAPSSAEAPESYPLESEVAPDESITAPESSISPLPPIIIDFSPVVDPGNTVHEGPWRQCPQYCAQAGNSTEERSVTCRNRFGIPIPIQECDEETVESTTSSRPCRLQQCAGSYYFTLSAWTPCSRSCMSVNEDSFRLEYGEQTRIATCVDINGTIVDEDQCTEAVPESVPLSQRCNTFPCEVVTYSTRQWSDCACENSTQTRSLECRNESGQIIDVGFCEGYSIPLPLTERSCRPQNCDSGTRKLLQSSETSEQDSCLNTTCSNRGRCVNGTCQCEEGFEGDDCQQDVREDSDCQLPGQLGPTGECCRSGVFETRNYTCCQGDAERVQLDRDGSCCAQELDLCGVCGGLGVVDVIGRCCGDDAILDPNGYCCRFVDECGVCEGTGTSCAVVVDFEVRVPRRRVRRACGDHVNNMMREVFGTESVVLSDIQTIGTTTNSNFEVVVNETSVTTAEARRNLIAAHFDDPAGSELCPLAALDASRRPDCGNGVCEIGEPIITSNGTDNEGDESCREDCDFVFDFCAVSRGYQNTSVTCSGHGRCLFAGNASCDCYEGYTGDNCEQCSSGHYRIDRPNFRCLPRQSYVLSRNEESVAEASAVEPSIETEESAPAPAPGSEVEPTSPSSLESPDGIRQVEGLPSPSLPPPSSPSQGGSDRTQDTREADSSPQENNEVNSGQSFTSNDDDFPVAAVVVPSVLCLLVCLVLAVYLARKRNQQSTENYAQKKAFKLKEVETKPASGTPSRSYNQVWSVFRQSLATGILTSRKHGTSDSNSGSKSRKELPVLTTGEPSGSNEVEEVGIGGKPLSRKRVVDVRNTPSSSETTAMRTTLLPPRADQTTSTSRRSRLMDVNRWNSRQLSIDGGVDALDLSQRGTPLEEDSSVLHQGPSTSADPSPPRSEAPRGGNLSTSLVPSASHDMNTNIRPIVERGDDRFSSNGGNLSNAVQGSRSDDEPESVRTATEDSDGVSQHSAE